MLNAIARNALCSTHAEKSEENRYIIVRGFVNAPGPADVVAREGMRHPKLTYIAWPLISPHLDQPAAFCYRSESARTTRSASTISVHHG